ncbi:hypothetical protein [Acinetobacter vivianii]|uniref:hypothetical protein n=1 Tax=Acinetobacter vivianii TaxID=1776742 RepID=UPI0019039F28|nr:hypothetical protein [Acinetobacter vivianii]MBJ8482428.1 hypothetical protein [Acinetobacter vivianii]
MMKYIPDLDQEEETLITAKIDAVIEKLRKKRDEKIFTFIEEETKVCVKIKIESSLKS